MRGESAGRGTPTGAWTPLGSGPIATVYSGLHQGSPVALKVFPSKFDRATLSTVEKSRGRLREVGSTLPVHAVDQLPDGRHALRMELCPQSLAMLLPRAGRLNPMDTVVLGHAAATALAGAHAAGVVHGGVKPSNVLFRASGQPVLADFGIALRQAFPRDPVASLEYLAPETLRTETLDERTDLYGLGALLHVVLTGRHPLPSRLGEPVGERVLRLLRTPVPAIHEPGVPVELSTVVGRLLAPDPARRPANAAWVADRLGEMIARLSMPVAPMPPPVPMRPGSVPPAQPVPVPPGPGSVPPAQPGSPGSPVAQSPVLPGASVPMPPEMVPPGSLVPQTPVPPAAPVPLTPPVQPANPASPTPPTSQAPPVPSMPQAPPTPPATVSPAPIAPPVSPSPPSLGSGRWPGSVMDRSSGGWPGQTPGQGAGLVQGPGVGPDPALGTAVPGSAASSLVSPGAAVPGSGEPNPASLGTVGSGAAAPVGPVGARPGSDLGPVVPGGMSAIAPGGLGEAQPGSGLGPVVPPGASAADGGSPDSGLGPVAPGGAQRDTALGPMVPSAQDAGASAALPDTTPPAAADSQDSVSPEAAPGGSGAAGSGSASPSAISPVSSSNAAFATGGDTAGLAAGSGSVSATPAEAPDPVVGQPPPDPAVAPPNLPDGAGSGPVPPPGSIETGGSEGVFDDFGTVGGEDDFAQHPVELPSAMVAELPPGEGRLPPGREPELGGWGAAAVPVEEAPSGRRVRLDLVAGGLIVLVVLGVGLVLALSGGSDDLATPERTPPPPAPSPAAAQAVDVRLEAPADHGTQVTLSWTSSSGTVDYAVIVAPEGEPNRAVLAQRQHSLTVPVDPLRRYCFEVQATDSRAVYRSEPQPIRGATCHR